MLDRVYALVERWERLPLGRRRLILGISGGLAALLFVAYLIVSNINAPLPPPEGSPTPAPTATAQPCTTDALRPPPDGKSPNGDLCSYISGFVAKPGAGGADPTPVNGALIYARLGSYDSGATLPVNNLLQTSTGLDGSFSFPKVNAAASWTILYGKFTPLKGIDQVPVIVVREMTTGDFEQTAYPECGSSQSSNQDASYHLGGDVRLVVRITTCPDGSVLANVVKLPILRAADASPSPTPPANPALVGVNEATDLRYDPALYERTRILRSGSNGSDPLVMFLLLAGVLGLAGFVASAYWISVSLRDLAHTDPNDAEI